MATKAKQTDVLALEVTPAAASHLKWAIECHNEAVERGDLVGTILPTPDASAKSKQQWEATSHAGDVDDLVYRLTDELKRVSDESGQSYPVSARNLAGAMKKVKIVPAPKAEAKAKQKEEPVKEEKKVELAKPVEPEKVPETLPEVKADEVPSVQSDEERQALNDELLDIWNELDNLDTASFLETDSTGETVEEESGSEEVATAPEDADSEANEVSGSDVETIPVEPPQQAVEAAEKVEETVPDVASDRDNRPNPIMESSSGILSLTNVKNPWELARDCVDYPIKVVPLYFEHNGEMERAESSTNSGRPTAFFGAAVDRNRTGHMEVIATVSDKYGLLMPAQAYSDLQAELADMDMKVTPQSVYVSNDGGRQVLTLDLDDMLATNCRDRIKMSVELITSVDGRKKHHMRLVAHNVDTGSEVLGLTSQSFNLSTRHTASINDRHVAFQATLSNMIKAWNDEIAPMMALMADTKFDRNLALDLLEKIMEQAEIPQQHRDNAAVFYTSDHMSTQEKEHSLYRVVTGMSEYLTNALEDKPERLEKFRENLAKKSWKMIQGTITKLRQQKAA